VKPVSTGGSSTDLNLAREPPAPAMLSRALPTSHMQMDRKPELKKSSGAPL
jgi:hypothetical protein